MNFYEINEDTIALVPYNNMTKVYEKEGSFLVNKDANKIIEESCEYFGSSYEGRKKGTTALTGVTHKVPIIIEESKNIIFFPTSSPRLNKCTWISLNHINKYYKDDIYTVIEFKNDKKLMLNISYGSLDNQILRASRLESVLRSRKK